MQRRSFFYTFSLRHFKIQSSILKCRIRNKNKKQEKNLPSFFCFCRLYACTDKRFTFIIHRKDLTTGTTQQSKSCESKQPTHLDSIDGNTSTITDANDQHNHHHSLHPSSTSTSIDGFMSLGHTCNSKLKNQKQTKNATNSTTSSGSLKRYGLRTRSKSFFGHQSNKKDNSSNNTTNGSPAASAATIDGSKNHLYHTRSASVVPTIGRSGSVSIEPLYANCSNTNTTGNIHNYLFSISGHSSMAPLTGNFNCGLSCGSNYFQQQPQQGVNYSSDLGSNGQPNFPDADFIMAKLAHTYSRRNSSQFNNSRIPLSSNGQNCSSPSTTKLTSGNFSKSAIDLRQETGNCNGSSTTTTGLNQNNNSHTNLANVQSANVTGNGVNVVRRTAASVKRFLLSQTSTQNPNSGSICSSNDVKNQHDINECLYGNIGYANCGQNNLVNSVIASTSSSSCANNSGEVNGSSMVYQLNSPQVEIASASLCTPFSRSLSHLSSKTVSTCVLEALSQKLMTEAIDLTEDPYSDASGFCGIPPALVQRYADELAMDLYEIAESLDHLRLEALAVKGRRGVS